MLSLFPLDVLDGIWDLIGSVSEGFPTSRAYRGLIGEFLSLRDVSVAISVSTHLMFVIF